jgi:hypothetical protein
VFSLGNKNYLAKDIEKNIKDCKEKAAEIPKYQSIFVGREKYIFCINAESSLYLVNLQVKPGTAFVDDICGVATSCYYGDMIVGQLKQAPKPMLVFVEKIGESDVVDDVKTTSSCGRIENYLKNSVYKSYGVCTVGENIKEIRTFEVRVYK